MGAIRYIIQHGSGRLEVGPILEIINVTMLGVTETVRFVLWLGLACFFLGQELWKIEMENKKSYILNLLILSHIIDI